MAPHAKVANLFPIEAPMNRPHSARFGAAKQFTKKAPRPNVNASYRNTHANFVPQNNQSFNKGVVAANQAILSRLNRLHPGAKQRILVRRELAQYQSPYDVVYERPYGGKRKQTRRGRKGTRKHRR
jgi:hypothetical protein